MKKENKRLDFNNQDFYVGIDVHKKQWTVTIRSQKIVLKPHLVKNFKISNDPKFVEKLNDIVG